MKKTYQITVGILSTIVGLYPVIYFLIDRKFGLLSSKTAELLSNNVWNITFYGHIIFGGVSLLIGWLQFSKKLRKRNINLHRSIGKIYVISVSISGLCGLYIALHATGGVVSILGFSTLDIIWLITTIAGFITAKKGNISSHQKFMTYSFAACFAAVTLRIWLPILVGIIGQFITAYTIVAWLCWVPNMLVAYYIVTKRNKS